MTVGLPGIRDAIESSLGDCALVGDERNRGVERRGVAVLEQRHRGPRGARTTRQDIPASRAS